jgi:hypothetical protein
VLSETLEPEENSRIPKITGMRLPPAPLHGQMTPGPAQMMVLGRRSRQRASRIGGAKPDDVDAAITTDPLVVADNADDAPKWLPDRHAAVATGETIKRRILYTTNRLVEKNEC